MPTKSKPQRKAKSKAAATPAAASIRDRVIEQRKVTAAELAANPRNFKQHGAKQTGALKALLEEIGFAGAALAYKSERAGGALTLIDGHLRQREMPADFSMACTIVDLTDEEADKLLLAFDPIAALAEIESEKLDALLRDVQTGSQDLAAMFNDMAEKAGLLKDLAEENADDEEAGEPEAAPDRWGVYIECQSEAQQEEVLERLSNEGFAAHRQMPGGRLKFEGFALPGKA